MQQSARRKSRNKHYVNWPSESQLFGIRKCNCDFPRYPSSLCSAEFAILRNEFTVLGMSYDCDEIDEGRIDAEFLAEFEKSYLMINIVQFWCRQIIDTTKFVVFARNLVWKYPDDNEWMPTRGLSVFEDEMAVSRCRSFVLSLLAVHRAAWCHGVLYFAYRRRMPIPRSTQQHFRNANATVFYDSQWQRSATTKTTTTFAPQIDFAPQLIDIPSTCYASSVVSVFFLCHSEYHVSLSSFVKLPVETLLLC